MPNFHTLLKNSKHQVSAKFRPQASSVATLTPARTLEVELRSMTAVELFSEIVPRCFATPSCSPLWNAGLYHRAAGKESIKSRTCLSHAQESVHRSPLRHSITQPFRLPHFHQSLKPHSLELLDCRVSPLVVSSAHLPPFGSAGGEGGTSWRGKGDKGRQSDHNLRSAFAFHFFHTPGGDISAVRQMASRASNELNADIQTPQPPQPGAVYVDSPLADLAARESGEEDHK